MFADTGVSRAGYTIISTTYISSIRLKRRAALEMEIDKPLNVSELLQRRLLK